LRRLASGDNVAGALSFELLQKIGGFETATIGSGTKTALLAAFLSCVFGDRPHDGIVEAANELGSDTDSIATMAGAILGCVVNIDPPEDVIDKSYIELEAERMFNVCIGNPTKSYEYPDMLYWQAPQNQVDSVALSEARFCLQGLGQIEPSGEPIGNKPGDTTLWQWFRTEWGQSMLLKRRTKPVALPKGSLRVLSAPPRQEASGLIPQHADRVPKKPNEIQPGLWDRQRPIGGQESSFTVDMAIEQCRKSNFRYDVIGEMIAKLAVQDGGIEKSVGFAALIARYFQNTKAHQHNDIHSKPG
jgi:hypothetical protein